MKNKYILILLQMLLLITLAANAQKGNKLRLREVEDIKLDKNASVLISDEKKYLIIAQKKKSNYQKPVLIKTVERLRKPQQLYELKEILSAQPDNKSLNIVTGPDACGSWSINGEIVANNSNYSDMKTFSKSSQDSEEEIYFIDANDVKVEPEKQIWTKTGTNGMYFAQPGTNGLYVINGDERVQILNPQYSSFSYFEYDKLSNNILMDADFNSKAPIAESLKGMFYRFSYNLNTRTMKKHPIEKGNICYRYKLLPGKDNLLAIEETMEGDPDNGSDWVSSRYFSVRNYDNEMISKTQIMHEPKEVFCTQDMVAYMYVKEGSPRLKVFIFVE